MAKLTLNDLVNLQNETTAVTLVNANNTLIETALENTLSRDGTSPNQMGADLDINSHRVINVSPGVAGTDAVNVNQLNSSSGGGGSGGLPVGGSTGQILTKASSTDFDAIWSAASLSLPLSAASGGTGQSSYTVGDLLYASGATTLSKLADVATGQVLISGGVGVAPTWSATPTVSSLTSVGTITFGTGTISGLNVKTVPNLTLDYLLLLDNVGPSFKKFIPGSILASLSGVLSVTTDGTASLVTNSITNSKIAVGGIATFKGNPGNSGVYTNTGFTQDIDIASTQFITPVLLDTTGDLLWVRRNNTTLGCITPANLATALGVGPAAGVASIDGASGVLTGYARHISDNRMYGGSGNLTLTGTSNTTFGFGSGTSLTTGVSNTFLGNAVGTGTTTGGGNIGIGASVLTQNIDGAENTAVGNTALYNTRGNSPGTGQRYAGGVVSGPNYGAITITLSNPGTINSPVHGLTPGAAIVFATNGTLPSSFSNSTGASPDNINLIGKPWYVASSGLATDSFKIAEYPGGPALQINGSQSGTHDYLSYGAYSGSENTAIGSQTMYANTYGHFNTALGLFALQWGELTSENTALGNDAMVSQTYGTGNTAVGGNSLGGDYDPVAGGTRPGSTHVGSENTALGFNSMIGKQLVHTTHTGYNNTAVGTNSLFQHSTGVGNTCIGHSSLAICDAGGTNIALGYGALNTLTSGSSNIAIGFFPGTTRANPAFNSALPAASLYTPADITSYPNIPFTGTNNIFVGHGSSGLCGIEAGAGNVFLGNNLVAASDTTNNIYIGDGAGHIRMQANSSGVWRINNLTAGAVSSASDGTLSSGTLTVPLGGTNKTSFTAYSVLCGGTTSTSALQNVVGVGTVGQVLTSAGAAALPAWADATVGGTVNGGTAGQLAYYATTTTAVSGNANATISGAAVTLGVASSATGQLKLANSTNANVITVQAPVTSSSYTFKLPTTAGSNTNVLSTDGSGNLSWSASGGTGTVTSVATSYPLSGGAITTTGTLTSVGPTFSGKLSVTSTTQLTFSPYKGDVIKIGGVVYQIPSAGITTGGTTSGLSANSNYYVYVFNNSGTLNMEISATGHATSSTAGNIGTEIKTGDDTRSLVGMVRTNGSTQFVDSAATRYLINWFNRKPKYASNTQSGSVTLNTYTTLTGGTDPAFLAWNGDSVMLAASGYGSNTNVGAIQYFALGILGTITGNSDVQDQGSTAGYFCAFAITDAYEISGDGRYTLTAHGAASAGTSTYPRILLQALLHI